MHQTVGLSLHTIAHTHTQLQIYVFMHSLGMWHKYFGSHLYLSQNDGYISSPGTDDDDIVQYGRAYMHMMKRCVGTWQWIAICMANGMCLSQRTDKSTRQQLHWRSQTVSCICSEHIIITSHHSPIYIVSLEYLIRSVPHLDRPFGRICEEDVSLMCVSLYYIVSKWSEVSLAHAIYFN